MSSSAEVDYVILTIILTIINLRNQNTTPPLPQILITSS